MRTSYLNRRSSGIRAWATWALCWVCFSLSQFLVHWASCHFPCAGLPLRSASTTRAFAELGGLLLRLAFSLQEPSRGCFSQVKSESQHHRCRGSLSFPQFCLNTTKIWSGRPVLHLSDGPVLQLSFIYTVKEHTSSRHESMLTQKTWREERPSSPILTPFFYMFFSSSPWACPM